MKKIGLICLTVVLALGSLGVAYALWSEELVIDSTVNTGEVNMEIVDITPNDPPGTIDPNHDKDVGSVVAEIDPGDNQRATITVTDAYPCYQGLVHFTVHNNGTVPVKLQAIIVDAPPCITVSAWDGTGEQIEPGPLWDPPAMGDNTIRFHVEQCADELATYTYTVEFYYVQWNEYVP
jgi:hypothetical protein